jgi:hypothetical protein
MNRTCFGLAALVLAVSFQPLRADEFEDVVADALEAYRDGDIDYARDEMNYAIGLLNQIKAEELAGFLPEPLAGWEREMEGAASDGMMSMLGGGTAASAIYRRGDDEEFTITLTADSPMVSGMAAMFSGMASMGGTETARIQRTVFSVAEGEVQGVVGDKVLVQASGSAPADAMRAHIESMDLRALGEF